MSSLNSSFHFSQIPPSADIKRSKFDMSFDHKTTMPVGKLVPIFNEEVLPGDTFELPHVSSLVRMLTPVFPVMDNAYMDIRFFYVPRRLVWEHWKEFMGENNTTAWEPQVEYTIPTAYSPLDAGFASGSIADHLGVPIGAMVGTGITDGRMLQGVDACYGRAYRLIWNEWYRVQALQDPELVNLGDTETDPTLYGDLLPVSRFPDYFSSALPAPQRGPSVSLLDEDVLNVFAGKYSHGEDTAHPALTSDQQNLLRFATDTTSHASTYANKMPVFGANNGTTLPLGKYFAPSSSATAFTSTVFPNNLYADATPLSSITINTLRQAFQLQKFYERSARSGGRYAEMLRSFFGVISPDASLQRPEYLGGGRVSINMSEVVQSSSTDSTTPQGNVAGMSRTIGNSRGFKKSFTEHGIILGLACIRTDRSYQQGLSRRFSRRTMFDFYFPVFANIGEQGVKKKEIYAYDDDGNGAENGVFGYQEAWADYRYHPNEVTGDMRHNSSHGSGLDAYHYADWYASLPSLSDSWVQEGSAHVMKTLAVTDASVGDPFLCDFYFKMYVTRPLPVYSVPGMLDHN